MKIILNSISLAECSNCNLDGIVKRAQIVYSLALYRSLPTRDNAELWVMEKELCQTYFLG